MGRGQQELSWSVQQRLEFIEYRLFWAGRVNRGGLMGQIGFSVNQASTDVNRYVGLAANIVYEIAPHGTLPETQAKAIALDYGMVGGKAKMKVRQARARYRWNPQDQQIVLLNRENIHGDHG
ncbi:hypothetical protein EN845_20255 [Mesorhizobium sp. M8A.F.Ca.ET.202.01.1.1]|nr:hypothetical protein EN845_20255 [Mesorhizobium sp. M8A.F.Ca.ET.202.01.1.1]TGR24709.1 hypothetical protein EN840_18900 [Mesorhizobium sp. M8A.F.Ca.ET.197.01.1.1]TGR40100.1 hypothetical protein EN842_38935 [bacterium M00.F.Ca.ET.199.01.1.1]TGR48531.1 hypothetical protein EN841_18890 [Mesorhizobium sp. M8A.F.Ca.ET.198.01.1.1]TGU24296.1 hypothetical protein EN799_48225 [bacterium M00.F.Ca.ET.156.01.1.1]TGV89380.1 hypothetical protein EN792_004195 [Mesorhizobium sp. M00.F.Ca.ET.149.01.1.1]